MSPDSSLWQRARGLWRNPPLVVMTIIFGLLAVSCFNVGAHKAAVATVFFIVAVNFFFLALRPYAAALNAGLDRITRPLTELAGIASQRRGDLVLVALGLAACIPVLAVFRKLGMVPLWTALFSLDYEAMVLVRNAVYTETQGRLLYALEYALRGFIPAVAFLLYLRGSRWFWPLLAVFTALELAVVAKVYVAMLYAPLILYALLKGRWIGAGVFLICLAGAFMLLVAVTNPGLKLPFLAASSKEVRYYLLAREDAVKGIEDAQERQQALAKVVYPYDERVRTHLASLAGLRQSVEALGAAGPSQIDSLQRADGASLIKRVPDQQAEQQSGPTPMPTDTSSEPGHKAAAVAADVPLQEPPTGQGGGALPATPAAPATIAKSPAAPEKQAKSKSRNKAKSDTASEQAVTGDDATQASAPEGAKSKRRKDQDTRTRQASKTKEKDRAKGEAQATTAPPAITLPPSFETNTNAPTTSVAGKDAPGVPAVEIAAVPNVPAAPATPEPAGKPRAEVPQSAVDTAVVARGTIFAAFKTLESLYLRLLVVPGEVMASWFDIFPTKNAFLGLCGYRLTAQLAGCEFIHAPRRVFEIVYADTYVKRGIVGNLNAPGFVTDYATFGFFGITLGAALVGTFLALLVQLFGGNIAAQAILVPYVALLSEAPISMILNSGGLGVVIVLLILFFPKLADKRRPASAEAGTQ